MPILADTRVWKAAKALNPSRLWQGRSVRAQLLVVIGIVNLIAAVVAGAVWVFNARSATRAEIGSSIQIAEGLASAKIRELASQGQHHRLSEELPQELKSLRHVRLLLMVDGKLTMVAPATVYGDHRSRWAPKWFAALIAPKVSGRSYRVLSSSRVDPVIIIGEPADEIAEAWRDFSALALIWLCLGAIVLVILYVVLGRVLDPLASLARGMQRLKGGRYTTRAEPSRVREIARINDHFNGLAGNLDHARKENTRLYRQLISTQEEVRGEIAHELHDEAGACLFGIAANASSIRTFADPLDDASNAEIDGHVKEILNNADRLKAMNRTILKQLRPGPIGQVSLAQLVAELLNGLQRTHRDVKLTTNVGELAKSYGEACDLTLYRCLQEGVTVAIRKAETKTVHVEVGEDSPARSRRRKQPRKVLRVIMRFDGPGFPAARSKELTLATMIERVRALGGSCTIRNSATKGTTIRIEIPVDDRAAQQPIPELMGENA